MTVGSIKRCACGCGNLVTNIHNTFIHGHNSKGKIMSQDNKRKLYIANKGKIFSEEHKRKLSESHKGKKHTIETRTKMAISKTGTKRSAESKRRMSEAQKGRKFSEESRLKMSDSHKGKFVGSDHPLFGKHHSKETKQKISISRKGKCLGEQNHNYGKPMSDDVKVCLSKNMTGKYVGEQSSNWKGGISFEPYCPKFNNILKEYIRNKYGRCCVLCGKSESENSRKLSIHHILYDKMEGCNDKELKLVPLCSSCHTKTNHNRDAWAKYFISFILI